MADQTLWISLLTPHALRAVSGAALLAGATILGAGSSALAQQRGGALQPPRTNADVTAQTSRSQLRERAIGVLEEFSKNDDAQTRANAIEALQKVPGRAELAIERGLRDENMGVRFVAAMSASRMRLVSQVHNIEPLLDDPEPIVRAAAICALRRCGRNADPTLLANMLASRDLRMRSQAAFLLGEIGDASAIPMLRDLSSSHPDIGLPSEQRLFRLQVAEALVKLGWKDAIHPVRAALYPSSTEEVEASILAAQILGELRDRASVAELVNRIEDRVSGPGSPHLMPPEMRLAATIGLAKMGYRDGRYVAIQYIGAPPPPLRSQAAIALGEAGVVEDLQILDALMLGDESPMVRVAAASAMVSLADRLASGIR
ncbi:MAG: HEAT repeat domain-containing protein [Phycisphaeraceae bacterium]|nr:HEAT repeat domain-containing protein [Phycisphaeraceae bacterium]